MGKLRNKKSEEFSFQCCVALPFQSCVSVILSYLCFSYLTFLILSPYSGKCKPARIMAEVTPKSSTLTSMGVEVPAKPGLGSGHVDEGAYRDQSWEVDMSMQVLEENREVAVGL